MYLGSADWMERNLDRRVEAVVPVLDPQLWIQLEWMLQLYIHDSAAWQLNGDGDYSRDAHAATLAQAELMERWGAEFNAAGR